MGYSQGPYESFGSLPSPNRTTLHSSRKVDFVKRRYIMIDDGNPDQMPSTRQRVIMAVAIDDASIPRVITDQALSLRFSQIQQQLQKLVTEGAILIKNIIVEQGQMAGSVRERVDFIDLNTGIDDTYERVIP